MEHQENHNKGKLIEFCGVKSEREYEMSSTCIKEAAGILEKAWIADVGISTLGSLVWEVWNFLPSLQSCIP